MQGILSCRRAVGRPELLELLKLGMDRKLVAELAGYGVLEVAAAKIVAEAAAIPAAREPAVAVAEAEVEPSLSPPLWRATGPWLTQPETMVTDAPEAFVKARELSEAERVGRAKPLPKPRSLMPAARLGPVLRRLLRVPREGARVDEQRLVGALARCRFLRRIPRKAKLVFTPRLQVVWDQSPVLEPCAFDELEVTEWLERWRGLQGMDVIAVRAHGETVTVPAGVRARSVPGPPRPPKPPDAGTTLLALTDLGMFLGDEERQAFWRSLALRAERAGCCRVALLLCPQDRWDSALVRSWHGVEWERARVLGGQRRARAVPRGDRDQAVHRLLRLASPAVRIETALLRDLRHMLREGPRDLGVELQAFFDRRVAKRSFQGIGLDFRAALLLREEFQQAVSDAERQAVIERLGQYHQDSPAILAEELIATGDPVARREGEEFFMRYARRFDSRRDPDPMEAGWTDRVEARRSPEEWQSDALAAFWVRAHNRVGGLDRPPPEGLRLERVLWALERLPVPVACQVWQRGAELWLLRAPPLGQGCLLGELPTRVEQITVHWSDALGRVRTGLVPLGGSFEPPETDAPLRLSSDLGELRLSLEDRPSWAEAIGRDAQGLWVRLPAEAASVASVAAGIVAATSPDRPPSLGRPSGREAGKEAADLGARPPDLPTGRRALQRALKRDWPPWASRLEFDRFGWVAAVELGAGLYLRLRWVRPGRFMMGSPEDERGRYGDEGPRHAVTLSEGYWVGETPVTQAEWEGVMGENPSQFRGAERPVETVSWEECREFCRQVNARIGGLGLRLPTEAECECACRAGTESAYNDGSPCTEPDGEDPALMRLGWFDKNSGGETHPVRELRPNAWGFYDMHGNVWEWCEDWYGPYENREQRDPTGPAGGRGRVIRGGGWVLWARFCRSASRRWWPPTGRSQFLGFRVARGQLSQEAEPWEAAASEEPSEGRARRRGGGGAPRRRREP